MICDCDYDYCDRVRNRASTEGQHRKLDLLGATGTVVHSGVVCSRRCCHPDHQPLGMLETGAFL